jgi:hypothetical protein
MVKASSRKRRDGNNQNDEDEVEQEYQVEAILDKRVRGKKTQYLLKWKGYSNADNSVRFSICFVKNNFSKKDIHVFFSRSFPVDYYIYSTNIDEFFL